MNFKQNPMISKIIDEFQIPDEILRSQSFILEDFVADYKVCTPGPISQCEQSVPGQENILEYIDGIFYIQSQNCAHWYFDNKNEHIKQNYLYTDFDIDAFSMNAKSYNEYMRKDGTLNEQQINERFEFLKLSLEIVKNKRTGLYLQGDPGIGKTSLLRALANTLAFHNYKIAFISTMGLSTKVKQMIKSVNDQKMSKFIKIFKKADILFLDDLGGETSSVWFRDEILIAILDYRYENKKITFFSSNFQQSQLRFNYTITNNSLALTKELENMKAKRFLDRIKGLSSEYVISANESMR